MSHLEGTITAWSPVDGVGRIRLADGEELRFGMSGCSGFPPAVGVAVHVLAVAPHPMGGRRASRVELARPGDADDMLDAAHPLAGVSAPSSIDEFVELTDAVALLGVVVREPLRSRAQLRRWLARGGVDVDFAQPKAPLVLAGNVPFRVYACTADAAGGRGVVSFAPSSPFSAKTERSQALAHASLDASVRVDTFAQLASLETLVRGCAQGEVAVIAHQARGFLVDAAEWIARAAVRPAALPLDAWTRITTSPGGDAMLLGMMALRLPDVFTKGAGPDASSRLLDAASALVSLGKVPEIGARLGQSVVAGADEEWVRVAPG